MLILLPDSLTVSVLRIWWYIKTIIITLLMIFVILVTCLLDIVYLVLYIHVL